MDVPAELGYRARFAGRKRPPVRTVRSSVLTSGGMEERHAEGATSACRFSSSPSGRSRRLSVPAALCRAARSNSSSANRLDTNPHIHDNWTDKRWPVIPPAAATPADVRRGARGQARTGAAGTRGGRAPSRAALREGEARRPHRARARRNQYIAVAQGGPLETRCAKAARGVVLKSSVLPLERA